MRFYTVPDAKTARHSVVWAMALIGSFYIMTTFLGFGAATIVGRDFIGTHGGTNMSAPLLAQALAGDIFFAFICAIAFATILAVVAGLTISASTSFAHDFWTNVIHRGMERKPGEEVRVARISAFVVGAIAIIIAILLGPTANVAFLVALAFAVAASANFPVIVLSIFWRRFNTTGAVAGLAVGLIASIGLDSRRAEFDGRRSAYSHGGGTPSDSGEGVVPAGKSRHPEYSARISRSNHRNATQPRDRHRRTNLMNFSCARTRASALRKPPPRTKWSFSLSHFPAAEAVSREGFALFISWKK